jgi:transcriptional regulator with XRE-family HTH domain
MALGRGAPEGGGRDQLSSKLREVLYRRRKEKGWTVRDLAAAAGISPSYVSLIENGHKSPDPATLERIGKALGLDREFLDALVTLQGRPADPHVAMDAAEVLMAKLAEADAEGGIPGDMVLGASYSFAEPRSSPALMNYSAALRTELPEADRYVVAIPMLEEGAEPESRPGVRERRPLWLDRQALPEREELQGTFAWRLSSRGLQRIRGVYRRGDIVVISPVAWAPDTIHPLMVFAVRHEGDVVLGRIAWTGAELVLGSSGTAAPAVIPARGEAALRTLVAGRVILAVQRFR